jgi:hypothetical protein
MTFAPIQRIGIDMRQPISHDYYMSIVDYADTGSDQAIRGYIAKAFTSTDAAGGEFIPRDDSAQIIKYLYLNSWARQTFGTFTIKEGDNVRIPKFSDGFQPENPDYLSSEITTALGSATAIRETSQTTTSVNITLRTIKINHQMQRRAVKYSVVGRAQMEAFFREQVIKELTEAEEDAIINGDTDTAATNINYSYDATDHPHGYDSTHNEWLIMWNGLRNGATGISVDVAAATPTPANFRAALRNLGKYAHMGANKVVFLVSTDLHSVMLGFTQLETLDKYGPNATILSGEVGKIYGHSVIVTNKLPNTQDDTLTNSTGIRSSSTGTNLYTEALTVFVDSPIIAVPANPDDAIQLKAFPEYDRVHMFGLSDIGFGLRHADAVVRMIAMATA